MKKNKMKIRKGFTLVELLAVIAILAILLLIIVPKVNDVLKDSKHSVNQSSTLSLAKTADLYYSKNLGNNDINKVFDGSTNIIDNLKVSGKKPDNGYVIVDADGNVAVGAVFSNTCYVKDFNDEEVSIADDVTKCDVAPKPVTDVIKEASENWVANNYSILETNACFHHLLTFGDLVDGGYISNDLEDPKTNAPINRDYKILITGLFDGGGFYAPQFATYHIGIENESDFKAMDGYGCIE